MSGGHFDYIQYRILHVAEEVRDLIDTNDSEERDEWSQLKGRGYNPETIAKFREAEATLRRAYVMAQRIDGLVSCDDGEDSFHRRWDDDLAALEQKA